MLREWVAFLDDFLRGHGAPAVAKAVVGIMSFAVLLGAVLGSTAIKSGALVAATLLMATAGVALLHVRRVERRELEEQKQLVSLYGRLLDKQAANYQVVDWDTTVVIDERGDARQRLHVRIRATSSELRFVRLLFGCGWDQPARFRHRVRLTVRNILTDGTPGTSLSQTVTWRRNGMMVAMIHFSTLPEQGNEVSFAVDLVWPGRCAPLVDGVPDEYRIRFTQPLQHVRYRIVVPPGASTYSEPISDRCFDDFRLTTTKTDDDRELITFEASGVPPSHTVGVRLELRDGTTRGVPASALALT
jgi:hypothetical protein